MFFSGIIRIDPVAKQRPKLTKTGRAYNPAKTRDAQRQQAFLIRVLARKHENQSFPVPSKTPLEVRIKFYHKGGPEEGRPKTTVPDIDNLLKLTLDAITNANIWRDDNQISKLVCEDLWAGPDKDGFIEIDILEHKMIKDSKQSEEIQSEPQQLELFSDQSQSSVLE